jgi:hypothetical protein
VVVALGLAVVTTVGVHVEDGTGYEDARRATTAAAARHGNLSHLTGLVHEVTASGRRRVAYFLQGQMITTQR